MSSKSNLNTTNNKTFTYEAPKPSYVKKEVLKEMLPYFTEKFGNPSSVYKLGQENKKAISEDCPFML